MELTTKRTGSASAVMQDQKGFLEPDQVRKLISRCGDPRFKLLMILAWRTGRRISELLELRPRDIFWKDKNIQWKIFKKRGFKGGVTTLLSTDTKTLELLESYIYEFDIKDDEFFFFNSNDKKKHFNRQYADRELKRVGEVTGITTVGELLRNVRHGKEGHTYFIKQPTKLHWHHFRHSFAVNIARLVSTGADLRNLQKQLCHEDIKTTSDYLAFNQKEARELLELNAKMNPL